MVFFIVFFTFRIFLARNVCRRSSIEGQKARNFECVNYWRDIAFDALPAAFIHQAQPNRSASILNQIRNSTKIGSVLA